MRPSSLKTRLSVIALIALAAFPAAASISTPEERRAEFDRRDENGDGFLSLEEYYGDAGVPQETREKTFAQLDADGDGKMSFAEYDAQRQKTRC